MGTKLDLPDNIVIAKLHGPGRRGFPEAMFSHEVVWSPSRTHFALAYNITEASMNNDVGFVMWARMKGEKAVILHNPRWVLAACWQLPWCRWLDEETFVFKAWKRKGNKGCIPLVAIHVTKGFQILPDTSDKWIDKSPPLGDNWTPCGFSRLSRAIRKNG